MLEETEFISKLKSEETKDAAFKKLISLYHKRLYWHIRKMVFNHDDSDDVLQNAFIKIYKNIHLFKGESKLYSWMYRIATNEAITFINKKAKRSGFTSEELKQHSLNSLEADVYFDGTEIQLKLQKAIASLPEKQQLVFNMKYFDDLTYEELSEILDTSVGALKSSYHIAVKKITALLTEN
ncbi:RNA polymerase sigma factor [uncultured Planktosalinus sp.]|uniref:RNA polymerase sigma factor n=1 Tax=uncultured Planktosalinus sp. TaxID=1810935 RepID=UPI0030DD03B5